MPLDHCFLLQKDAIGNISPPLPLLGPQFDTIIEVLLRRIRDEKSHSEENDEKMTVICPTSCTPAIVAAFSLTQRLVVTSRDSNSGRHHRDLDRRHGHLSFLQPRNSLQLQEYNSIKLALREDKTTESFNCRRKRQAAPE